MPYIERFRSESQDRRFVSTEGLFESQVPQVDTVVSGSWHPEGGAVLLIFLSCADTAISDRCARALGLLPSWFTLAALPSTPGVLSPRVQHALDRSSIMRSATPSMDRIWAYQFLEGDKIGAHCQTNVRIVDYARNHARGRTHSAKQADLLEIAIVANNTIRHALGDAVADQLLAEIAEQLATTTEDPAWHQSHKKHRSDFDWAKANKAAIVLAQKQEGYSFEGYPQSSMQGLSDATSNRCAALLCSLGRVRESQATDHEDEDIQSEDADTQSDDEDIEPDDEADDGPPASQEDDQGDNQGDDGDGDTSGDEDTSDDQPTRTGTYGSKFGTRGVLHHYDEDRIAAAASVAEEFEVAFGRRLPRKAGQRLPCLWFFPEEWDDHHCLSYAAEQMIKQITVTIWEPALCLPRTTLRTRPPVARRH